MDKKKYYVAIDLGPRAGQILDQLHPEDPHFHYEIEATPEEIVQLEDLFAQIAETDFQTYVKAHIPYETLERMQTSRDEDKELTAIYRMIYHLGTENTKTAMRQAGLPH